MKISDFPVLFLKATIKKQVTVPGYYRKDGTFVPPHQKMVHFDPDKEVHHVVSGQGSHSQKQAHKKLHAAIPGFKDLPVDEQYAHILSSATNIQEKASASAVLSGWKAQLLAGKQPTPAQKSAYGKLIVSDPGKAIKLASEVKAVIGEDKFQELTGAAPAQPEPQAEPVEPPKPEIEPHPVGKLVKITANTSDYGHIGEVTKVDPDGGIGGPGIPAYSIKGADGPYGHGEVEPASDEEVAAHQKGKAEAEVAQQKVNELVAGTGGHYPVKAAKILTGDGAWQMAGPVEQLTQIVTLAKKLQAAATASAAVSGHKKAIENGKMPSKAEINAFLAMPEDKQVAAMQAMIKKHGLDHVMKLHNGAIEKHVEGKQGAAKGAMTDADKVSALLADGHPVPQALADKLTDGEKAKLVSKVAKETGQSPMYVQALLMGQNPEQPVSPKTTTFGADNPGTVFSTGAYLVKYNGQSDEWEWKTPSGDWEVVQNESLIPFLNSGETIDGDKLKAMEPEVAPAAPKVTKVKAEKVPLVVKKLQAIDPAEVQAWFDWSKTKKGPPQTGFFEQVNKQAHTKFFKWHTASQKFGYPDHWKAAYRAAAVGSLFGMPDQVLMKDGSWKKINAVSANETPSIETDIAKIHAAAIAAKGGPKVEAPAPATGWDYSASDMAFSHAPTVTTVDEDGFTHYVAYDPEAGFEVGSMDTDMSPADPSYYGDPEQVVEHYNMIGQTPPSLDDLYKMKGETGPKDGDTKPAADGGTLVFKDGRWHKQSEPKVLFTKKAAIKTDASGKPVKPDSIDPDNMYGMWVQSALDNLDEDALKTHVWQLQEGHSPTMKVVLPFAEAALAYVKDKLDNEPDVVQAGAEEQVFHNTSEGHNKFWSISVDPVTNTITKKWGKIGTAGQSQQYHYSSFDTANKAAKEWIAEKLKGGYYPHTLNKSPASSAAPKVSSVKTEPVKPNAVESVDGWHSFGGQGGYNPGGYYRDQDGVDWYCKFPTAGEDVIKNELLATKLYAAAGVNVPDVKLVKKGGQLGIASKVIKDAAKSKDELLAGKASGLLDGFAVDAWLANWDVVGNNPASGKGWDNILFKDGVAHRIDAGGAMLYGGAGGKKSAFGDEVIELKTMLDPKKNDRTAAVFGKMSEADIAASVAKVLAVPEATIKQLVDQFGPGSAADKAKLAQKLINRQADMAFKFPKSSVKAKPKAAAPKPVSGDVKLNTDGTVMKKKPSVDITQLPDPRNLVVDPAKLTKPHDFLNWNGAGKPISEKPYVQQNIKDEQALFAAAQNGDLVAFAQYKFQPVDKMTGEPAGSPKPMSEHPSMHVKQFYESLLGALNVIANPAANKFAEWYKLTVGSVQQLDDYLPAHKYGVSTGGVPADERLGFWIALGEIGNWQSWLPKPKKITHLSGEDKAAAHSYTPALKKWLLAVKGSGSANQPYRDGKEFDSSGNFSREVLVDAYSKGRTEPVGTTIYKWIDFNSDMLKQMLDEAEPGLVFQNPGSMCCSMKDKGTSDFGMHRLTIRYAEGAKALPNYGLGSSYDSGEAEITTIPGVRFMLVSKQLNAHGAGRHDFEILMLPPDPSYIDDVQKKTAAYKAGKDWKNV